MDPILYRAEPEGRLTPLYPLSMCRVRVAGGWLSLTAASLMDRLGSGAVEADQVVSAGYLRPYRPQPEGLYGWAPAVFGHDAAGIPCALILPAEAPPPPSLEAVVAAGYARLIEERDSRVDLYAGRDARARDARLMVSVEILDRVQTGTDTAADRDLMGALRQVGPLVRAHDAAAALIRQDIAAAPSAEAAQALVDGIATDPRWPA
jgi:hypothetical protein